MLKRTLYCGDLRAEHVGQEVTVCGWVGTWRDHGGVVFIDLRDRSGICQAVFNPQLDAELHRRASELRTEYCISVRGKVESRPEGMANPKLPTGQVEVLASQLEVYSSSEPTPFDVDGADEVSLEARMRNRFLDLRRPDVQRIIMTRSRMMQTVRRYFDENGFVEVETPFLTKSTPEGARDYLVPSRVFPGSFYALPQSPQLFKQILMIGGMDRYFQIVKCFRDEDVRATRQPEFTQIDAEMSFADEQDVMCAVEGMMARLFKEVLGKDIALPLPRIKYQEALDRFGSDAPDLRFGLEIRDVGDLLAECEFKVFRGVLEQGGSVRGICVPDGSAVARTEIDRLIEWIKQFGLAGLAWFRLQDGKAQGGVAKFLKEGEVAAVAERFGAGEGALILLAAAPRRQADVALSHLRRHVAEKLGQIPEGVFNLCWVVEPPAFEHDPQTGRLTFPHHPFTAPFAEDVALLDTDPVSARTRAYDLVVNGVELGGGSVRIADHKLQMKIFDILGYTPEEVEARFGFFLNALRYGPPPHAGIGLGFDRIVATLVGVDDIRETIAFPKTQKAVCMLTGAPAPVAKDQLGDLGIHLDE